MSDRILMVGLATVFCLAAVACRENNDSRKNDNYNNQSSVAADNTGKNKVDRDAATKTPIDQSESSPDIRITAEIRREIMKVENMSVNAQNCKIITDKGVVTLRGPVNTIDEKTKIGNLASNTIGVVRVDNELEIKTP